MFDQHFVSFFSIHEEKLCSLGSETMSANFGPVSGLD